MEAIVLAGGFGTRLREKIADLPKPMAPVAGKPFLSFVLTFLQQQGVQRVILATGYMHEKIASYYGNAFGDLRIDYSIEKQALGTGGGIRQALQLVNGRQTLILNGDTFFAVDIDSLCMVHRQQGADLTLALKPVRDVSRYGCVQFSDSRITAFEEKKYIDEGYINGGVYVAATTLFDAFDLPGKFSFEEDFLKRHSDTLRLHCYLSDTYFIDIGVPEDYERAQIELEDHAQSSLS